MYLTKVLFLKEFLLGQGSRRKVMAHSKVLNPRAFSEGNIAEVSRTKRGVEALRDQRQRGVMTTMRLRGKHRAVYQSLERTIAGTLRGEEPTKGATCAGRARESGSQALRSYALLSCTLVPSGGPNRKPEGKGAQLPWSTGLISWGIREAETVDLEETDRDGNSSRVNCMDSLYRT